MDYGVDPIDVDPVREEEVHDHAQLAELAQGAPQLAHAGADCPPAAQRRTAASLVDEQGQGKGEDRPPQGDGQEGGAYGLLSIRQCEPVGPDRHQDVDAEQ